MHVLPIPECQKALIRRSLIFFLMAAGCCGLRAETVRAADKLEFTQLSPSVSEGDMQRVKVVLKMTGDLQIPRDAKQTTELPVQMTAELMYDEKITKVGVGTGVGLASVRYYSKADATIKYDETQLKPTLRDDRRIIAVSRSADSSNRDSSVSIYSPLGPLTRDELDLMNVAANSLLVDSLLPDRTVVVGKSWDLNCRHLGTLLGLEAVQKSSLKCTLNRLEGDSAIVHLKGTVTGAAEGVASEIRMAAKYSFDTRRKRIGWFAMSMSEARAPGHSQPGSNVTVQLQMATMPLVQIPTLDDSVLADLALDANDSLQLLELQSDGGGFQLLSDRNWHVIADRPDVTVLRMVDRGDLVAQCNVSSLPKLGNGKAFGMVEFQEDVKRALDENRAEFVAASESRTESGLKVMRVVAAGEASSVPIQWIYYHIGDEQGRRASCIFTLEADLAERFNAADQTLVSSFNFLDSQSPIEAAAEEPETAANSSDGASPARR